MILDNFTTRILCFSLLACFSLTTSAAMYKWVDEDGNVHYSEKPPPGDIEVQTIKPPPKVDSEKANQALQEQLDQLKALEEGKEPKEQAVTEEELAVKKHNCELGKDKLQRLQDNPRVYTEAEDGTRTRLGEEEREARIQEAQQMIKDNC